MSSRRLMERFQRTLDEAAFEEIYARFYAPALVVARRMLRDRARAEDAVQQAFVKLVDRRRSYRPERPFAPWFYAMLRNVCRDMLRRTQASPVQSVPDPEFLPRAAVPDAVASPVLELMERLPRGRRAVLELRVVQGMKFRQVGQALGISEEAAKKRAQRGLRQLREFFFADEAAVRQGGDREGA